MRDKYIYYRCTRYDKYHLCPHKKRTSELVLEEWLLDNLLSCVAAYNAELSARARPRSNVDPAGIRRKMEKLKDLYLNDLISRDVYEQDYTSLRDTLHAAQLAELDAPAPVPIDPVQMRTALETYHTLSRLGQREFWSRVIKQIVVTNDETFSVVLNSPY